MLVKFVPTRLRHRARVAGLSSSMILDHDSKCVPAASKRGTRKFVDDAAWRPIGKALRLSTRAKGEQDPRLVTSIFALANFGFAGDRHASSRSPRQLLVAGSPAYERFDMAPGTLRENVLIDFPTDKLRSGNLLRIGDVTLWMTFQCEPCSLLERRKPGLVKTIRTQRGMLARVLVGGELREGEPVFMANSRLPVMSDDWRDRVLTVVESIPYGKYITYRELADLAGVATAYCRAFPKILGRLPSARANRVRSASADGPGEQWDGATLYEHSHGTP